MKLENKKLSLVNSFKNLKMTFLLFSFIFLGFVSGVYGEDSSCDTIPNEAGKELCEEEEEEKARKFLIDKNKQVVGSVQGQGNTGEYVLNGDIYNPNSLSLEQISEILEVRDREEVIKYCETKTGESCYLDSQDRVISDGEIYGNLGDVLEGKKEEFSEIGEYLEDGERIVLENPISINGEDETEFYYEDGKYYGEDCGFFF